MKKSRALNQFPFIFGIFFLIITGILGRACISKSIDPVKADKSSEPTQTEHLTAEELKTERLNTGKLKAEELEYLQTEQQKLEQEKTKQEKAKQEKAEQEKTQQEKAEQEKAEQEKTEQEKTQQEKAKQEKTQQEKTQQEKAKQEKTEKVIALGYFKGSKLCEECHEAEDKIWKKTKHYTSFRTAHREPKDANKPSPKTILATVGGNKRMKRNKACSLCHYTLEQADAEAKPVARSGVSCEKCHGASSEWLEGHEDYGGKDVKRDQETPAHKKERYEKSKAAGLIWPFMKYEIAENCMTCHGLAHPGLTGDTLTKMLEAGHPINPDFELVKYSQGSVRHRYFPPDRKVNAEMTKAEQAELFVIGHAAALVSAKEAISKSTETKYMDAQNKRSENARAALSALKNFPEAAALMTAPNRANALKLVRAIEGKDLPGDLGNMLPMKKDYK